MASVTIVSISVPEGSEGIKVGAVIATLASDDEDAAPAAPKAAAPAPKVEAACAFVRATGGRAAIGALAGIEALVDGSAGTQITLTAA